MGSGSALRGKAPFLWAMGAILAVGCCVLVLPGILLSVFAEAKSAKEASDCRHYLRQIGQAIAAYQADFDGTLPGAEWMDSLGGRMPREKFLRCPSAGSRDTDYGYALNAALLGRKPSEIEDPATPLVFDTVVPGRNAVGGVDSMPQPPRHLGSNNFVRIDGRVETTSKER